MQESKDLRPVFPDVDIEEDLYGLPITGLYENKSRSEIYPEDLPVLLTSLEDISLGKSMVNITDRIRNLVKRLTRNLDFKHEKQPLYLGDIIEFSVQELSDATRMQPEVIAEIYEALKPLGLEPGKHLPGTLRVKYLSARLRKQMVAVIDPETSALRLKRL